MNSSLTMKLREENHPEFWRKRIDKDLLSNWMGQTKTCPACARSHTIKTKAMIKDQDCAGKAGLYLKDMQMSGRCKVIMDIQTRAVAGDTLMEGLKDFSPEAVVFERDDLHADEQSLGTLLTAMSDKPDFLVSCGSGTLTDITRYNAYMAGIPFVAYATAASVDGFASGSTPLLVKGFKTTYPGIAPDLILYDPSVLAAAPQKMIAAGFGDVLAKIIALIDWRLAYFAEDEAYCPLIAGLVDQAVEQCLNLADDLAVSEKAAQQERQKKETACSQLMEALSLTGLAMQMMGTSRPASGSDHHISHLLEMRDIQRHKKGSLHGDKVGIGTLIGMTLYMRLFEGRRLPVQKPPLPAAVWEKEVRRVYGPLAEQAIAKNDPQPPQGKVWETQKQSIEAAMASFGYDYVDRFSKLLPAARDHITAIGGPVRPDQLGYSIQDTYDAIAHGKEVRPKFTTLRLAERFGWLYDLAEEIADGLPAGKIY